MQFSAVLNIFIVKTKLNSIFTNDLKKKYFFSRLVSLTRMLVYQPETVIRSYQNVQSFQILLICQALSMNRLN